MARIKATSFTSHAEFESALDQIAAAQVNLRTLEAYRDRDLQAVRDRHAPAIDAVAEFLKRQIVLAEKYAETHRDEVLPGKLKSAETALAVFGFRKGNPTLKPLNKRWTWDSVLEAVKARFKGRFIRTKEELDKDAIKAQLDDEQLAAIGCRIDQADDFFVEAKEQPTTEAAVMKGAA